jgi:prepilin-type N-terminal cleavage/methylation domain-containing protein
MNSRKNGGFTIIEVVLVLAIAGLVFLIVFLALPQLQRSRRDHQRKQDLFRVIALMENFRANTGRAPVNATDISNFNTYYLGNSNLADPKTGSYTYNGIEVDTAGGHREYPSDYGQIYYKARHFCTGGPYYYDEDSYPARGGSTDIIMHNDELESTAAVWAKAETGGYICIDNGSER